MSVMEYKCPSCGGKIEFDSQTQQMKCPFCDTTFDVEALKNYDEELSQEKSQGDELNWDSQTEEWREGEEEGMRVYSCESCGGEIIGDASMAATSCPFCGNPTIIMGQFTGMLKPDLVIPFKLDKKAAKEALKKHYGKKRLLPKVFKNENHLEEIKGIYVPFWLFDGKSDGHITFNATKVRTWSDSSNNYTETSHFNVMRSGDVAFKMIPVDGSDKMADEMMESIEPYDWNDVVDFQTAYLSGYLADRYDVDSQQAIGRANERIVKSTIDLFSSTVEGFSSVNVAGKNVKIKNGKVNYALLPVWILNTKWKDKMYYFAMNGQTGKLIGDLPMDKGAFAKWFIGITAGVTVVVCLLAMAAGLA